MKQLKGWFRRPVFIITLLMVGIGLSGWVIVSFVTGRELQLFRKSNSGGKVELEMSDMIQVNQPFLVVVKADTHGQKINAIGLQMTFDASMLQVTQMDTRASFCQFYPEKKYDNKTGIISLACGSPHPGYAGNNTIMTLEFLPLNIGISYLRVKNTSEMLLSDGKGTNILNDFPAREVKIGNLP